MGGAEGATARVDRGAARPARRVWFAAPPLMHAAAQWTVFAALHNGGTVVLHDDSAPFDARTILETADARTRQPDHDRRRCVRAPDRRGAREPALRPVVAATARDRRRDDEPGAQARAARVAARTSSSSTATACRRPAAWRTARRRKDAETQQFRGGGGAAVLSDDRTPLPRAGRRRDRMDGPRRPRPARLPERSATQPSAPSPIVDGRRIAVPGDRAHGRAPTARSCCSDATRW